MRDLPPQPPDVVQVQAWWDVNGDLVSTAWWVFAPGADDATPSELEELLSQFYFSPIADLLPLLSTDTSLAFLRCVTRPAVGLTMDFQPAPNAGALDGTTALNAALVLTWRSGERRVGAHAHTWLPLSRSNLGADKRRLGNPGYAEAASRARLFVQHVAELTSPDGATCVLVTLHRVRAGVVLPIAEFAPILDGDASPVVGTLRRRTRNAPRAPSAP